ncbi:hypothetical protein OOJ91_33790 [Micromonospora lupini]|uniref:hypothetical protein n=1 Tax=Micromonospora lupini TaxID=285679 RepID=UPI0022513A14|nr:hypothetical protein [Micromonospora lupini]MCX5070820.1 hypothetical protein [Micromonospora lupini]
MPPQRRKTTEAKPAPAATPSAEERSAAVEATAAAAGEPASVALAGTSTAVGPLEPSAEQQAEQAPAPAGHLVPSPLTPPATDEQTSAPAVESPSPLEPPAHIEPPAGSRQVLDSPVAPLDPPAGPPELPRPAPQPPAPAGETLGYVDDEGHQVRIADVFDLTGDKLVVVAKRRVHVRFRRPGITTVLQSLLYPAGAEVHRAVATALVAEEKAVEGEAERE